MGYRIVRICVAEKILEGVDDKHRDTVRCMLEDLCSMDDTPAKFIKEIGVEEVESIIYTIEHNLDRIRGIIDELPRGMTKERFTGGISKFYNEMYLLKDTMGKLKGS
jgi:hypothetical protein